MKRKRVLVVAILALVACSHSGDDLQQRQSECFAEHSDDSGEERLRRCMAVH